MKGNGSCWWTQRAKSMVQGMSFVVWDKVDTIFDLKTEWALWIEFVASNKPLLSLQIKPNIFFFPVHHLLHLLPQNICLLYLDYSKSIILSHFNYLRKLDKSFDLPLSYFSINERRISLFLHLLTLMNIL